MFTKQLCLAVLLASALTCAVAETGKKQAEQDFIHALLRLKNHIDMSMKVFMVMYLETHSDASSDDAVKEVLPQTAASVKQMIEECYQKTDTDERKLCPYMDIQFQYAEPLYTFQAPKKDRLDGLHPETQAWIQNHPEETGMAHALLDTLSKKVER